MKVMHVITGLNTGGAEMMLYKLLKASDRAQVSHSVVSMQDQGSLGDKMVALGVNVQTLHLPPGKIRLSGILALRKLIKQQKPDVIQAWMYHANLLCSITNFTLRVRPKLLWGIRQSLPDIKAEKRLTQWVIQMGASLSKLPAKIIYNAKQSAIDHQNLGYRADKTRVIANGFDVEQFTPSAIDYQQLRQRLNLPETAQCVGLIARYHPVKDHATFIAAASLLCAQYPDVYFVLAGTNVDTNNVDLQQMIAATSYAERFKLLGAQTQVAALVAGLDIVVLASKAEAFPNVIGEAMACGVPCVSTAVGDVAEIIADTGYVVPVQNPQAMAEAIGRLLNLSAAERQIQGLRARQRIVEYYSIEQVAKVYQQVYQELLA
jgi:glycosyltransferase involved in cell wall biosynthesis